MTQYGALRLSLSILKASLHPRRVAFASKIFGVLMTIGGIALRHPVCVAWAHADASFRRPSCSGQ